MSRSRSRGEVAGAPRRAMPHNLDAEQSVIGGILIRNESLALLSDLEPDRFYDPRHKAIFGAIRNLEAKRQPLDVVTLEAELDARGKLDAVGGVAYLGDCAARTPDVENVVYYAGIVRDTWRWRCAMLDAASLLELGYSGDLSGIDPMVETAEIAARAARAMPTKMLTLGEAVATERRRIADLVARRAAGEQIFSGLPLGFRDVDDILGGAPFGTITLLLGLRGGAKTTISQRIASRAAASMARAANRRGVVVMAYNEDTPSFFAQREVAQDTRGALTTQSIGRLSFAPKGGVFSPNGWATFNAHADRVIGSLEAGLILLPIAGMDGFEVGRILRRIHAEHGLAGFVIDYLQRMKSPKGVNSKSEGIGVNSNAIGDCAQDTGAAAIVNAQLDPEIEKRDWKEGGPIPRIGDTRWSKDPESDARLMFAIYDRWAYGKPTMDPLVRMDSQPGRQGETVRRDVVELHTLKQTMGEKDQFFPLRWIRESHYVGDLDPGDDGSMQMKLGPSTTDDAWAGRMDYGGRGDHHS